MSFTKGFNFRDSNAGAFTDLEAGFPNETYALRLDAYPTTRNGVTFGWVTTAHVPGAVDRDSTVDRRLAGVNYEINVSGATAIFRVDLPATGTYRITLALGDTGAAQTYQKATIYDGDTSGTPTALFTITDTDGTLQDHYDDANGTDQTEANWISTNGGTTKDLVFATTILSVEIGANNADATATTIAHLFVSDQLGAGPVTGAPTPPITIIRLRAY